MTEEQIKHKAEQKYKEHLADPNYCENSEEESFYTGYVEGYLECQKANEWHYVKDGDLPKDANSVWLCFGVDDYLDGQFIGGRFWCGICGWFDVDEVVAWQELVPPSEPMRSVDK